MIEAIPVAQRRTAALEIYLAFYWSGANLLTAVCKKEGVDLSDYAKAYADRYVAETTVFMLPTEASAAASRRLSPPSRPGPPLATL